MCYLYSYTELHPLLLLIKSVNVTLDLIAVFSFRIVHFYNNIISTSIFMHDSLNFSYSSSNFQGNVAKTLYYMTTIGVPNIKEIKG